MKTLTLILVTSFTLSSCTQGESNPSNSQLLSNNSDCVCQPIAKNSAPKQKWIIRGGVRIMKLKIDHN